MSWPPATRHTAASSSNTKALVLEEDIGIFKTLKTELHLRQNVFFKIQIQYTDGIATLILSQLPYFFTALIFEIKSEQQ